MKIEVYNKVNKEKLSETKVTDFFGITRNRGLIIETEDTVYQLVFEEEIDDSGEYDRVTDAIEIINFLVDKPENEGEED